MFPIIVDKTAQIAFGLKFLGYYWDWANVTLPKEVKTLLQNDTLASLGYRLEIK